MEIFQLIYIALCIASSIVFASCENPKILSADIKFQAHEYQSKLSGANIDDSETSSLGLNQKLISVSKAVDSLSFVLSTISKADVTNETKITSTRSKAKAIVYEILHTRQINNQFRLQALVKSLDDAITNLSTSENYFINTEKILDEIIETFANGDSPFYKYPALAIPTLTSLASFVETFVEILIAQNHTLAKETGVPCYLADTIFKYFKPTLIDRFNEIEINTDFNRYVEHNKYVYMAKISNQRFYMDGDKEYVRCIRPNGGKNQYENDKLKFLPIKTEQGIAATFAAPKFFFELVNKDSVSFSLIKDNLGNEEEFYHEEDIDNGYCALDYFSLIRHRLESEFGPAYDKALRACKIDIDNRDKQLTGFGWLTIKVGSLLVQRLADGSPCDLNKIAGNLKYMLYNTFCDPYVKITVTYELNGKRLKIEHKTDLKKHAAGWTTIDETFHFDKIPLNSEIHIEIINKDDQHILSKAGPIPQLLNRILLQNEHSKLFIISDWRAEMV